MDIFLQLNGAQSGPYSEQQVRDMLKAGTVTPGDYAWRDGFAEWQPLAQVITLGPLPPPPPPPKPIGAPARRSPAQPAEKPKFRVTWVAGLLMLAIIGLDFWIFFGLMGIRNPNPRQGGMLGGAILRDAFLVPAVVGWIAWLVCGRSQRAGTIALGLAVCGMGFFEWNVAQHTLKGAEKLQQLQKDTVSDLRKNLQSEDGGIAQSQQQIDRLSQQLGSAASDMRGSGKLVAEASQRFLKMAGVHIQKYAAAYQALKDSGFTQAKGINTREDLQRRRDLNKAFGDANEEVAAFYRSAAETFRAELTKGNLGENEVRDALEGFNATSSIPLVLQIRQCDSQLVEEAGKIFDVYDREWGKWRLNSDDKILFENSSAAMEFNSIQKNIGEIAAKQEAIQRQILQKAEAAGK